MTQDSRIIAAGGAVGRCGQAEPEHLLGGVDIEQVPRGGRASLLHHQDRRAASGITGFTIYMFVLVCTRSMFLMRRFL